MRAQMILASRVLCGFLLIVALLTSCEHSRSRLTNAAPESVVLIDAGHGGVDGGASAPDGTLEKDVNLAIAKDLYAVLTFVGVPSTLVRDEDVSIHDAGCTTIRQKKVSDMKNRLKQYDASAMVVSIHQNHFSVSKYSGSQVFYSPNHPISRVLAQTVCDQIEAQLQSDNTRQIKAATDSVYLLHHTIQPAILVECGFLSNPSDTAKLKTTVYQQQLAMLIASGILEVYGEE